MLFKLIRIALYLLKHDLNYAVGQLLLKGGYYLQTDTHLDFQVKYG